MITPQDAQNIISIIDNTSFKGSEVEYVTELRNKLVLMSAPQNTEEPKEEKKS